MSQKVPNMAPKPTQVGAKLGSKPAQERRENDPENKTEKNSPKINLCEQGTGSAQALWTMSVICEHGYARVCMNLFYDQAKQECGNKKSQRKARESNENNPNSTKMNQKSTKNRPKIDPKSSQNRPQIGPESVLEPTSLPRPVLDRF